MVISLHQNLLMKEKNQFRSLDQIAFSNFSDTPWPCYTPPFSEELLTSWLTRTARNHLVRFYSFCSSNFAGCEFWNRDLDRFLPTVIEKKIQSKCVLKENQLQSMLLTSFSPNIFLAHPETKSFWITLLNFYLNNRKHHYGMAVCPECLRRDGETPFYRKSWRLALSMVCTKCHCRLIDSCPQCNAPINFLLAERGNKFQAPLYPITSCWKCMHLLSKAPFMHASEVSIRTQEVIDNYILTGCARERGILFSHLYFDVLKKIISIFNKRGITDLIKLQEIICDKTGLPFLEPQGNKTHPFNTYRITIRSNLLQKAFWLLEDWPDRFRETTKECGLKSKFFLDDFKEAPYWFKKEIDENNKVVFSQWRKSYPGFSYSSFNEFSEWQFSKASNKKPVGKNLRLRHV